MSKLLSSVLVLAFMLCASFAVTAQNIPPLSSGVIRLINEKERGWKLVPSKEKTDFRDTSTTLRWKHHDEWVEVILIEKKTADEAAKTYRSSAPSTGSISGLGDESQVSWGDPGCSTNINFFRGRMQVLLTATSAEIAARFARHIDQQIQATNFTDKWGLEDVAVVEFSVKDFLRGGLTTPVRVGVGAGSCGGGITGEGTYGGDDYSYSMSVYKIEKAKAFLNLSISMKNWNMDRAGNKTITKSGAWQKKFSMPLKGVTKMDLGDGVEITAHIEKQEYKPPQ